MFEAPQLDEAGKILVAAADLIKEKGWWNGKWPKFERTICATMAVNIVGVANDSTCTTVDSFSYTPEYLEARRRLMALVGAVCWETVPSWNDRQNAEKVISTLREAAYNK